MSSSLWADTMPVVSLSSAARRCACVERDQIADLAQEAVARAFLDDALDTAVEPQVVLLRQLLRRDHDDRHGGGVLSLAERLQELEAVHLRHHEVEQNQRRLLHGQPL